MAAVSYNEETDQALEEVLAKPQDDEITMAKSGNLKEKKFSFLKLRRIDSLNLEAGRVSSNHSHGSKENWKRTLSLAFQSIGIIYGDIGTSPLYVFSSTFPNGIKHNDDILGVLSLIIYTIILIPMLKYVFIVLRANDNGDGGTFALYSLICRYANVGLLPNQQPEDKEVSTYKLETPSNQLKRAEKIKTMLESSKIWKIILFLVTILGTSMVMGDGVLTPCISVLSAISGIKGLHQDAVVGISIAIIILLFSVQRFGTDKVGFTFAPAITLWFLFISLIGLYNLITHDIKVLRAFNPVYIIDYFKRNGKDGWISLGGVVLCITGTEAMFADLGHFSIRAIQISFSTMVFPSIVIAYIGQAAYLSKHLDHYETVFYDSIPGPLYWPQFVVAVAAAIIASQAMISGAFAIISQSLSLGCFPRVKVVHTSAKYDGQVYIPEVNFILMLACVFVTWGFKSTTKIGNAYGIAVVAVMLITTLLLTLIMLVIWKTSIWWIALFFIVFFSVEAFFFSSVLYKFVQGGYLPLAFSLVLMVIMAIWHYVHKERYMFELNNKVSSEYIKDLAKKPDVNRAPGIGLLYSELVQGIPPIFPHFVSNIPSVHSVTVLVSVKSLPIGKVALEEQFLFRHLEPRDYRVYRCVVRRGYNNKVDEPEVFEAHLVEKLKEYIMNENVFNEQTQEPVNIIEHSGPMSNRVHIEENMAPARISSSSIRSTNVVSNNSSSNQLVVPNQRAEKEIDAVQKAMDHGVFYLLGEAEVVAKKDSSLFKKFVVNYAYSFLRKNFREGDKTLAIPRTRLLKVGMVYEI